MTHYEMSSHQVAASVKVGNAIANHLAKGKPLKFDSAVRHMLNTSSYSDAIALVQNLMALDCVEARKYVDNLAKTKNVDIVSPHCK